MEGERMKGTRVYPGPGGWLDPVAMAQPGAYGRLGIGEAVRGEEWDSPLRWWQVTSPSGEQGSLNPKKHTVVEHEDGTITVSPSIDFKEWPIHKWHGFLERGIWRKC